MSEQELERLFERLVNIERDYQNFSTLSKAQEKEIRSRIEVEIKKEAKNDPNQSDD